MIGHAVHSKEALYDRIAKIPDIDTRISMVRESPFQVYFHHEQIRLAGLFLLRYRIFGGKPPAPVLNALATSPMSRVNRPVMTDVNINQVCSDCPASLVPFHVKYPPRPSCASLTALQEDETQHAVWDHELCPDWCMETAPVSQTPTQSGPVDVRECKPDMSHP